MKTITEDQYKDTLRVIASFNVSTIKMPLQSNIEDTEPGIAAYTSNTQNRISALTGDFLLAVFHLFFKNGAFKKPNLFTWIKLGKHAWVFIKSIINTTKKDEIQNNIVNISGTAHRVY